MEMPFGECWIYLLIFRTPSEFDRSLEPALIYGYKSIDLGGVGYVF